ncbi:MAG: hypothetical protein ACI35P_06530 [Bacillus sp. (in: firmicutes)]
MRQVSHCEIVEKTFRYESEQERLKHLRIKEQKGFKVHELLMDTDGSLLVVYRKLKPKPIDDRRKAFRVYGLEGMYRWKDDV